jgi:hypothetical protein
MTTLDSGDVATRIVHACAECGGHIDGDEVKRRTKTGWLPFHPVCAPDADAVAKIGITIFAGSRSGKWWGHLR